MTVRLEPDQLRALDELAARSRLSRSALVRLGVAAVVADVAAVLGFVEAASSAAPAGVEAAPSQDPPPARSARRRRGRRGAKR